MKKPSIGLRLTLWYVAILAAAQLAFGAGAWWLARKSFYRITDEALQAQIEDLSNFLHAQKKNADVAKLQEEVAEAYVIEHSGDYLQLYDDTDGEWIFRAGSLQKHSLAPPSGPLTRPSYRDVRFDKTLRLLTEQISVNGRLFTVETGLPIDQIDQILALFRRSLVLFAPILLLAAGCGGLWLSRRALSPVDAITRSARRINATNLSDRLEELATGDELQRLSDTLNEMLSRIEDAFKRVTQFTADASHELRTPISLIRTEAEIALRKSRGDAEYREALRHILLEAERTTTLIEELLSLARADSGRETLHMLTTNLTLVVQEVGERWKELMAARDLDFTCSAPIEEVKVLGDPDALRRILAILLDNAAKYTPAPGNVRLRLENTDSIALVTVSDSGIGISAEDQQRIFERFYRVDKARSRNLGGAGIGLAIAQWIVLQHKGSIRVQSSPSIGTTFIIELPLEIMLAAESQLTTRNQLTRSN